MSSGPRRFRFAGLSAEERERAIAEAAKALREGGAVVLPMETVYGVAASGADAGALEKARRIAKRPAGAALAWHAASAEDVLAALAPTSPLHKRALRRLAPGPVTFVAALGAEALGAARERAGLIAGAADDGKELTARATSGEVAARVIAAAGVAVVAVGVPGAPAVEAPREGAMGELEREIDMVLDDGPTKFKRASTALRLDEDGGVRVISEGAIEERHVRRRLERVILFVCTGNTCRSPMAAAIAEFELAAQGGGPGAVPTRVLSAGAGAGGGSPVSDGAREALAKMGVPMRQRVSRRLTREMVLDADVVYGMTRSHAERAAEMAPDARGKVDTLDPAGSDIEDPVGMAQAVYDETANRIRALVRERLKALDDEQEA